MSDPDLSQRLAVVERLTKLYKPERTVHLVVSCASLLILFAGVFMLFRRGQLGLTEFGMMIGPTGLISYTATQVLRMWDRALSVVAPQTTEDK